MNRDLIIAIVLISIAVGLEQYGEHRIQVMWDLERAKLQAIADKATEENEAARKAIEDKHRKDVEYAKSQAGRNAVAAWLKSHCLLPDGSPVSGSGSGQTDCTCQPNGTSGQSGTSEHIEGFAQGCALDALHVLRWQEWAEREGLRVFNE